MSIRWPLVWSWWRNDKLDDLKKKLCTVNEEDKNQQEKSPENTIEVVWYDYCLKLSRLSQISKKEWKFSINTFHPFKRWCTCLYDDINVKIMIRRMRFSSILIFMTISMSRWTICWIVWNDGLLFMIIVVIQLLLHYSRYKKQRAEVQTQLEGYMKEKNELKAKCQQCIHSIGNEEKE